MADFGVDEHQKFSSWKFDHKCYATTLMPPFLQKDNTSGAM